MWSGTEPGSGTRSPGMPGSPSAPARWRGRARMSSKVGSSEQACAGSHQAFSTSWHCGLPDSMGISRPSGPAVDSQARLRDDLENEGTPHAARIDMKRKGLAWASTFPGFCIHHEAIFFDYEQKKGIQTDQHVVLQIYRTVCREI